MNTLLKLLLFVLIAACSSETPTGKTQAEILYRGALEHVESGRYLLATEKLNTIKSQHPYSFYAVHAELLLADILFMQDEFVESAAAYLLFRDFHPKHQKIEYVIWKIGESYYNQLPSTFDRDLSSAQEAVKYYSEIIEKYPTSEYKDKAQKKIAFCQKMIKSKEKYIADFYYKTDLYEAARFRYLLIVKQFEDKELVEHAKVRVVNTSLKMKRYEECQSYASLYSSDISQSAREDIEADSKVCKQKMEGKKNG